MSAASLERPAVAVRSAGTTRTRQLRPARGGGRGTRPVSRSVSGVPGPSVDRRLRVDARACRPQPEPRVDRGGARPRTRAEIGRPSRAGLRVADPVAAGWHLTNRGIAVVLIAGAVLAAAALTVITATAVTVTSQDYHPHGSALAHR